MRWAGAAILIVLTLASPSMAAPQAQLTAESVSWTAADDVHAELLALRYIADDAQEWQLRAEGLHVEIVETAAQLVVPDVMWTDLVEPQHHTADYRQVDVAGQDPRAGFVYATRLEGADAPELHLGCAGSVAGYERTELQVPDQVQRPNPNAVLATNRALHGVACGDVSWCGSFQLAVWSWTLRGTHEGGSLVVATGRSGAPIASAAQAYLTITNGCLTLPRESEVLANAIDVQAGSLHLNRPQGVVSELQAVGQDLALEGDFTAHVLRGQDRSARIQVDDGVESATLDGLTLVTIQAAPARDFRLFVAFGLIGSVLATAAVLRWPRRTGEAEPHLETARKLLADGRLLRARLELQRALVRSPGNPEALALRGFAHEWLGHPRQSLRSYDPALTILHDEIPDEQLLAWVAYRATCCAASLGQRARAIHYLRKAVRANPACAHQARDDPALAELALEPTFQEIINEPNGLR